MRVAAIRVVPTELERAAGRLQASADQVRSVVGTLVPTTGGITAGLGDAALAERFQAMWSRWASELGVIADDLAGAAGRLHAAAAEYRSTDRSAVPPGPHRAW
jgi:WXG100 family type VII secretion target